MKQNSLIFLIIIFKLVSLDNPEPIGSKYNILLTLKKFNIEPSHGLCKEIGMKKAQGVCVQNSDGFLKLRRQQGQYSQRALCGILKLPYCGGTCCMTDRVCQNSAIVINDETKEWEKQKDSQCANTQPTLQEQCNASGLLWCAGQCCGFSSKYHKCFRTNHYGVAYVRCPIEASQS